ncbi:hypothetical protein WKH00_23310, partial [Pantoea agglomerans]|uniref:hypothetical protein n=1 Tax=Enterobacter agglomerans TaxID=549 RepID=UPI003C7DEF53
IAATNDAQRQFITEPATAAPAALHVTGIAEPFLKLRPFLLVRGKSAALSFIASSFIDAYPVCLFHLCRPPLFALNHSIMI